MKFKETVDGFFAYLLFFALLVVSILVFPFLIICEKEEEYVDSEIPESVQRWGELK